MKNLLTQLSKESLPMVLTLKMLTWAVPVITLWLIIHSIGILTSRLDTYVDSVCAARLTDGK